MPGKILRRCTICKKFHASYLVEDPELGRYYLCQRCWTARTLRTGEQGANPPAENVDIESTDARKRKSSSMQGIRETE
jgi:hypothetical protein